MSNISGAPGTRTTITPVGSIPGNTNKGIICVQGETKRGEVGKNYLIGTWEDFKNYLGGLRDDSDFPLQCKQALESGSRLRIARAFHFTDIDDASTVDGTLAEADLDNVAVAAVTAKGTVTISAWTGSGSNLTIEVPDLDDPTQTVEIANYNGTLSQTPAAAAAAIVSAINGGTGTHGYTATNPSGAIIIVSAPAALGALANGFTITFTPTSATLANISSTLTGGSYVGGAYISTTLATWTGSGSNLTITVPSLTGSGNVVVANYNGLGSQSRGDALIAVAAEVNGGTVTHGYTAILLPAFKLVIKKTNASGAGGNGSVGTFAITAGTLSGTVLKFANGVTAYGALTSTWTAKAVGEGYNGTIITVLPSNNNRADYVDITVTLPDSSLPQVVSGVTRVLTSAQLVSLNKRLLGVEVSNLASDTLPVGTVTLSGGVQDIADIVDADYTGSSIAKNGWHSFDDVTDSMRIFNVARRTHLAAFGLQQYLEGRRDMRGRTYTPQGLTIPGLNDFRDGSGAYSHQPLDSFYLSLWLADLLITDPTDVDVNDYPICGGGFQCATRTLADNNGGEWYSDSGNDFGRIRGVNDVRLNLGSPGNSLQYDVLYEKGLNAIVNDEALKIVNFGNRTTLLDTTSLLSKDNIADLVVYIAREVRKIAKKMNFKPNDIQMFNLLYRNVRPWIVDTLVAGRAIEGDPTTTAGEGVWWHWLGDQLAKNLNDLKVNNKNEVDAGKYRARFAFKPIAANEYIVIDLAPANSTTILNVAQLTNLNA